MQAKEIKNGSVVVYNGAPFIIESISVQSPSARGAATLYKFRARNIVSKQKTDITLKGAESLEEADFQKRPVNIMYADASHMHFLDQHDYQQYSLPLDEVESGAELHQGRAGGCAGLDLQRRVRWHPGSGHR